MIKVLNIYAFFTVLLIATSCTGNQEVEGWMQSCNNCTCVWLNGRKAANCSNLQLNEVPSHLSREMEDIDLSGNPLRRLGVLSFLVNGLIKLEVLRCQNCSLISIHEIALDGLVLLKKLDLSKNRIVRVYRDSFRHTRRLESLNLSFNRIHSLESSTFSGLYYLQEILLNDNQISFLKAITFEKLPSLQHINLANNEFEEIFTDYTENLPEFNSTLDLQGNPWICDCRMEEVRKTFLRKKLLTVPAICAEPSSLKGNLGQK
ncbi:hypothetical protein HHI36_022191 [Cryptolaemus montrouzieri]|uniref:Uncharacterized protein n=1 Tax=Cryptolaemus montrouzieri TaxID=559131 RepID=A0ABD2MZC1_9CUCU